MRRSLGAVTALAALLAAAEPALAQRITGNIVGTVKDDTGAVLPGVTVSLTGEKIVGTQTTVSNSEGFYRFIALPPGSYDVSYALGGFATLKRPGIKVSVGGTDEITVSLKVSQLSEEVTVTEESPVIDTQTNQISTNYDKDWVRNAPVPRFSMFDLLALAPGVSQSAQGATTMSTFGSGVDENSFQIDGTNLTAPSTGAAWPYPNTDAIEEIEVLSLGAPAEYGNLVGAVFNVVTRQGTNEFHGDLNYYFQTDGLTSRNTTDAQDGGFPFHRQHFRDLTVQLSGPIVKDKLHFFASFQYQRDAKSPAGVRPQDFTDEKADRIFAKLNWQISPKHKLALGYHNDYYDLPDTPTPNDTASTVGVNYGQNPTPNLMYTGVLSDKTVIEARVAGFWGDDHRGPIADGEPRIKPRFYDLDTTQITGGVYSWYDDKSYQATASAKISHFADEFLGASHDFKFGVQYVTGGVHDAVAGYNDYIYAYNYTYNQTTSRYGYGYEGRIFSYGGTTSGVGGFFDDAVRVNERLTLNVGLRFDTNKAKIPDRDVRDRQGNTTGEVIPGRDLYTWNVFSPRLGFTYKLTKDGKTALKGHWGRYYRGIVTAEYSNSVAVTYDLLACSEACYDFEAGRFVDTEVVFSSPGNQSVDSNYENPYTDQFIVSLERELVKNLGLSLHYVRKRGRNGSAWRDTTGQFQDVSVVDATTGLTNTFRQLVSDPADSRFVLGNQPDIMRTDNDAFTAELVKRMSGGWQFVAAYTYLDSEGALPLTLGKEDLTDAPRATAYFSNFGQNPNHLVNASGKLLGHRPHTFRTQLVAELPWGLLVGANYTFQSGRPWARQGRVDLGFPTETEVRLEARDGSRRVPNQSLLDVRLQKSIKLGGKVQLQLFGDALNLFNSGVNQAVLSRFVDEDTFDVPSEFVFPRRLILGAKLTF